MFTLELLNEEIPHREALGKFPWLWAVRSAWLGSDKEQFRIVHEEAQARWLRQAPKSRREVSGDGSFDRNEYWVKVSDRNFPGFEAVELASSRLSGERHATIAEMVLQQFETYLIEGVVFVSQPFPGRARSPMLIEVCASSDPDAFHKLCKEIICSE